VIAENSLGDRLFTIFLYLMMALLAFLCVAPFIHVISLSLSSNAAIKMGAVGLWPVDFHTQNYQFVLKEPQFMRSFGVSVVRVVFGVSAMLIMTIMTAYPLSRDSVPMFGRTPFKMIMLFSGMFGGGLIPTYMAMRSLHLTNNFLVLILPGALAVFSVILVMNFFRGIPVELTEAAELDGASHWDILFRIFLPVSLPVLATISLFSAVGHWNSWFDGVIYMDEIRMWPLQSYLYARVTSQMIQKSGTAAGGTAERMGQSFNELTPEGLSTAMILVATIPILLVYPFLQRYFVKGLTLGSVKG